MGIVDMSNMDSLNFILIKKRKEIEKTKLKQNVSNTRKKVSKDVDKHLGKNISTNCGESRRKIKKMNTFDESHIVRSKLETTKVLIPHVELTQRLRKIGLPASLFGENDMDRLIRLNNAEI